MDREGIRVVRQEAEEKSRLGRFERDSHKRSARILVQQAEACQEVQRCQRG